MLGCERCLRNRIVLDVNVYGLYLYEQDMFVYFSKFNCWHQFLFVNILTIKICPLGIWAHKEAFRSAVESDEKTSAKIIFAVNSSDIYRLFFKRTFGILQEASTFETFKAGYLLNQIQCYSQHLRLVLISSLSTRGYQTVSKLEFEVMWSLISKRKSCGPKIKGHAYVICIIWVVKLPWPSYYCAES